MSYFIREKFNFEDLFIFDLANNHKGRLDHGRLIVSEFARVAFEMGVRAAIKFQLRNLETLVHPAHQQNSEFEYISYFQKNRLKEDEYQVLVADIKKAGLLTIATPFDEESVDLLEHLGIEVVKIASSSATDWPLLERVVETGKPVIISTAGLMTKEVDNIVSFFNHRGADFAIMHCVAIYPTPTDQLNLDRISWFKNRYPDLVIGFSTHEDPDNFEAIKVAYVKGARLFERHIGIETEELKLNEYSSRPLQIKSWLKAYQEVKAMCGENQTLLQNTSQTEEKTLEQFQRGVYAKRFIHQGTPINKTDVFFAMPFQPGQLKAGELKDSPLADQDYSAGAPLSAELKIQSSSKEQIVYQAIHEAKGLLNMAKIFINYDSNIELSHHDGVKNFFKVGALIIDCINREYCKKIIVMLPDQVHPAHYHKKKEETFQVLSGELHVDLNGRVRTLFSGDTLLIPRGVWHSFYAPQGVIFEEISTTHFNDDSFYADKKINKMAREERKTKLINWERPHFEDFDRNLS